MLVADPLLVASDSLDCENTLLFGQKSCVQLVVRHDEEEYNPNGRGEKSVEEENDLPWSHWKVVSILISNGYTNDFTCEPMLNVAGSNAIGDQATKNLAHTIETAAHVNDHDHQRNCLSPPHLNQIPVRAPCSLLVYHFDWSASRCYGSNLAYLRCEESEARGHGCFEDA